MWDKILSSMLCVQDVNWLSSSQKYLGKKNFDKAKSLHYFDLTSTNISIMEGKVMYRGRNSNIWKRKDSKPQHASSTLSILWSPLRSAVARQLFLRLQLSTFEKDFLIFMMFSTLKCMCKIQVTNKEPRIFPSHVLKLLFATCEDNIPIYPYSFLILVKKFSLKYNYPGHFT